MRALVLVAFAACNFQHGISSSGDGTQPGDAHGNGDDAPTDDARLLDAPPVPVRFVQGTKSSGGGTEITATFTSIATGGDLDVLGVSWASTNVAVSSVSDSDGNTYSAIGSPIVLADNGMLALYAASDVRQGTSPDTITVRFASVVSPIVVAAEYSGLAEVNPIDVTAAGTSAGGTSASAGPAQTNHGHDLLVGIVASGSSVSAGVDFTPRVEATLDLIEDREVETTGSYDATAALSSPGGWTIALVAFIAAN